MRLLFIFVDGVGLGSDDPASNPFALAKMPILTSLLDERRLVQETLGQSNRLFETETATLLSLDATLGVSGSPQSATGQAAIITGKNVPRLIGEHFGPKPNPEIRAILKQGTLFSRMRERGQSVALLNAYPQTYFEALESGRRLPGVIAMAFLEAGIPLKTTTDLLTGQALSADFTGEGWHTRLNISGIPVITAGEAGERLAELARKHDLSFFEYWLTDYAGHRADLEDSCQLLETFDEMLGGLLGNWSKSDGLILMTSDHGNLEDTRSGRHTSNPVPTLVIGDMILRKRLSRSLQDLTQITPAILQLFE